MTVIRSLRGDYNFRRLKRSPSVYNRVLTLRYLSYSSEQPEIFLAIVASKKVGKAVIRNRVRRRLREAFRAIASDYMFPKRAAEGLALVIHVNPEAAKLEFMSLKSELVSLLKKGRLL